MGREMGIERHEVQGERGEKGLTVSEQCTD